MNAQSKRRRDRYVPSAGGAVHFHIEHLVLRGVAPADAPRLADALQAELALLAARPGLRLAPIATDRLPASRIIAGRAPEHTGRAAASAIWSGIAGAAQGGSPR